MKKILTGILALLTVFACATACKKPSKDSSSESSNVSESIDESVNESSSDDVASESSSDEVEDELADAAAYLEELYKNKDVETRQDYEVLPAIWGFNITWSVDVTEGVSIENVDGKIIVNVDEMLDANLTYVLTASVADESGRTVVVSFERTVLAAPSIIPVAITEAPVEGTAYKFHLYQSKLGKDLYFAGAMDGFYFATTEESESAVDICVEYVTESNTEFYLYFNHVTDGKQYIGVEEAWNSKNSYWTFNVVYKATPFTFVWSDDYDTIITTVPCRSKDDNKNQSAEQTTTQTLYLGTYGTYDTVSASTLDKAATSYVGKLVTMIDRNSITPETKVAESKEGLTLVETEFVGAKEVDLPTARHEDVKVEWTVSENAYASISNGKLVIVAPEAETTVTLTATLSCGEVSDTKEFTITLKPAVNVPAPDSTLTIPEALELGAMFEKDNYTEGKYYVVGTIKEVYNTTYGNMYIKDADGNELTVYGTYSADGSTRYDAMESKPVAGDIVKVYGIIGSYNAPQMKNGWIIEWTAGEGTPDDSTSGDSSSEEGGDVETTWVAVVPEVDKPYIFGMTQGNLDNAIYYLAGGMNGFYMETTTDASKAIDTYIEATESGYYFYTYVDGVKTYINMVVSGTHVNGAYEAAASTVYTIDETNKTLIAVVNDTEYWFATRNDKTYTTMGPCAVSYAGFFGVFYAENEGDVVVPDDSTSGDSSSDSSVEDSSSDSSSEEGGDVVEDILVENAAYKMYIAQNKVGVNYFVTGEIEREKYLSTTVEPSLAVDVYAEKVDAGYCFYFTTDTKYYINITDGILSLATETPSAYTYDTDTNAWVSNGYYLGTYNNFTTIGASATSYINSSNTGVSQFPAQLVLAIEVKAPTAEEKIAYELDKLSVTQNVSGEKEITLDAEISVYTDATISWSITEDANNIASLSENVLSIANPASDATVTITATVACGETSNTQDYVINVTAVSGTIETTSTTYDLANSTGAHITAAGQHALDSNITMDISNCSWRTEGVLRIYANTGVAIFSSTTAITEITFNIGNKDTTVTVSWSIDGENWENETVLSVTSAYADQTVSSGSTVYKYVKFSSAAAQVRIETITFTTIVELAE